MIIDLPITIIFDCEGTDFSRIERSAATLVATLRYDTADFGFKAVLFDHYPPRESAVAKGLGEDANCLLAYLPSRADEKIKHRADANPYDYMVGTEDERILAQAKVDAEKEPRT